MQLAAQYFRQRLLLAIPGFGVRTPNFNWNDYRRSGRSLNSKYVVRVIVCRRFWQWPALYDQARLRSRLSPDSPCCRFGEKSCCSVDRVVALCCPGWQLFTWWWTLLYISVEFVVGCYFIVRFGLLIYCCQSVELCSSDVIPLQQGSVFIWSRHESFRQSVSVLESSIASVWNVSSVFYL